MNAANGQSWCCRTAVLAWIVGSGVVSAQTAPAQTTLAQSTLAQSTLAQSTLAAKMTPMLERHAGLVSVAIRHLESGESFEYQATRPMPTASLIKLPVMIEAYRQIDAGTLDASRLLTLRDDDRVPGSGVLADHFSAGARLSVRDAIQLMIAFSDNTATNLVIDQIGLPSTSQRMEQLGCPETKLHAKVFRRDTSIAPDRSRRFGLGSTTAREMVSLLERLYRGELASSAACQQMRRHLQSCRDNSMLRRFLPPDIPLDHKSGAVAGVRCDAGIMQGSCGPIAVCVLTADNRDQSWSPQNEAEVLCGRVAQLAFQHFNTGRPLAETPLRQGDSGPPVELLQRTLNARLQPSPELSVDGDFGPQTASAVERFQRERGLQVTGRVVPGVWRALEPLVTESPAVPDPQIVNSDLPERLPPDDIDGPPFVTCRAWSIVDGVTGQRLWGSHDDELLDPASTTKVMTAYVVLRLAEQEPDILDETVVFSEQADRTIGSTADIHAGERVAVSELLYGLMLPSGNDAATALAEHFGHRFDVPVSSDLDAASSTESMLRFIARMNQVAGDLNLAYTKYKNPHGLTVPGHVTSANDLARLAWHAMQLKRFCQIVGTSRRGAQLTGSSGYRRNVLWTNTNQLLGREGYDGIKTGTTRAAGACLIARGHRDGRSLIVVVLGATSGDARYVDARNLFRWAWQQLPIQADSPQQGADDS